MADLFSGASAQITPFSFNTHVVRVIPRDGAPWFFASEVAATLGYQSPKDAARYLDADEKGSFTERTLGGDQSVTIISESGLYALVLRSRKPEARKFAKWVTAEVLPAIRKTGGYALTVRDPVAQAAKTQSAMDAANLIAGRVQSEVFRQIMASDEWAHERWLLSFGFTATGTQPQASLIDRDAYVLNAAGIAKALMEPGFFSHKELLEIALSSSLALFKGASASPRGYGDEVAQKIKADMPQADLHTIAVAATMEMVLRVTMAQAKKTRASH